MTADGTIPTLETYRGVGIHDFQPRERIETVVKPAIDAVHAMTDPRSLAAFAESNKNPPEARLLASARVAAIWEVAAENRENRPPVDMPRLQACVAGLNSLRWIDERHYASLLDPFSNAAPQRDERYRAAIRQGRPDWVHDMVAMATGGQ